MRQINKSSNQARGLVGFWPLDSQGTCFDLSDNRNNGTPVNAPTCVSGKFAPALNFNGSNQCISIPNSTSLNPSFISISAWIKTSNTGRLKQIISKDNYDLNQAYNLRVWQFRVSQGNKIQFLPFNADTVKTVEGNTVVTDGLWHFTTATWDGSLVKIYVDGFLDNSPVGFSGTLRSSQNNDVYIGIRIDNNAPAEYEYFNGSINDLRIYNRALSAAEVNDLYVNPQGIYLPNRRLWVPSESSDVTIGLTGLVGDFGRGIFLPTFNKGLTGTAVKTAKGVYAVSTAKGLTGKTVKAAEGNTTPALNNTLTGKAVKVVKGTTTFTIGVGLTGRVVKATKGSATPETGTGLTGKAVKAAQGTLTATLLEYITAALTGMGVTFNKGIFAVSTDKSLTGKVVKATAGITTPALNKALTGKAVKAAKGTLTALWLQIITASLTGMGVTFNKGTFTVSTAKALTSKAVKAAEGSIAHAIGVGLTGKAIKADKGTLAVAIGRVLTGLKGAVKKGLVTVTVTGEVVVIPLVGFFIKIAKGIITGLLVRPVPSATLRKANNSVTIIASVATAVTTDSSAIIAANTPMSIVHNNTVVANTTQP